MATLLEKTYGVFSDEGPKSLAIGGISKAVRQVDLPYIEENTLRREEMKSYAAGAGQVWYGEPEAPLTIPPPEENGGSGEYGYAGGQYEPYTPFVCELPDCKLFGPRAVGVSSDDRLILESVCPCFETFGDRRTLLLWNDYLKFLLEVTTPFSASAPPCDHDVVFPMVSIYHRGFYAWMVEYLPMLRMLERYEAATGREPTILLQPDAPSYERESLELAGISPERIAEWQGSAASVSRLVVSHHRFRRFANGFVYNASPTDLTWIRDRFTAAARASTPTTDDYSNKVYVSRQEVSDRGRRVSNHDDLLAALEERGFESYVLEDMSFESGVRLFANADVVVGPHGAGLATAVFSEDADLLEITHPEYHKSAYYLLAQELGHSYEQLVGDAVGDDIHVDVEDVLERLDSS